MNGAATQSGSSPSGPIIVLGATGMLGTAWSRLLARQGISHATPPRARIDLANPHSFEALAPFRPSAVVNCAGYTRVDDAESHEADARQINAAAVGHLAAACAALDIPLLHYSTDYIFNGQGTSPYPADATPAPVNAYGRTKLEGEKLIAASGARALIIRTSWLYAPWGANFVRTIAAKARENPTLRVVNDQRGRPTSAEHLALSSLRLLQSNLTGVFHVTDEGECTWFEFAREIARLTGAPCTITPCATREFPRPAPRPAYSVLDLSKATRILGQLPHWQDNLARTIASMPAAKGPAS